MVVGILVIVLMSLPLCCGVLKQYGKAGKISGADSWVDRRCHLVLMIAWLKLKNLQDAREARCFDFEQLPAA